MIFSILLQGKGGYYKGGYYKAGWDTLFLKG